MGTKIIFPDETIARFWKKVKKTSACWEWTAYRSRFGYGVFRANGKPMGAHIFSFAINAGAMPENCVLHSCDNPSCVNPQHLSDGTKKQNTIDSVKRGRHFESRRTHCNSGHEFDLENTFFVRGGTVRRCRKCDRVRAKKYSSEKRMRQKWEQK